MALPDAAKGENGRLVVITWVEQQSRAAQNLTGAVLTGTIRTGPGPSYTSRSISGALVLSDASSGIFSWAWDTTDTGTAGNHEVQIIATISGVILKTFYTPWEVRE